MRATYPRRIRSVMRYAALATLLLPLGATAGDGKPNSHKPRDLSKGNTMYVVPYAHLDTQWRWAYPQVIREFIANTLHRNFDLLEKYPNYVFNFSGSRRYEMMKQYYPAEYERLKGYVKAGRWFPCGSSVDENDANVPSAESLVRQVLYGNHYFRKEFGVASDEYMLPDCFGFPYALPTILSHCGIKGFSTQKLTWNSANGIPFKVGTWEGPDGKSIVSALDPGGYGARVDEDLSQNTSWLARIQNTGKLSGAYVDYHYYGTGDTGGSPTPGSVEWVEKSIAGSGPITVVSSHADEMYKSLTPEQIAKLPHYKGELLLVEHSAGSVSSEAMMKRWNRKNELLAQAAEGASTAAMWLGKAGYPSQRLYNAWDLVLGSQMHDMLPGTSIPKAYEFCWNDELLASNQFAAIETNAVSAIASAMDTRAKGVPLVVYNPLSIARRDVVEATLPNFQGNPQVYAANGTAELTQVLSRGPEGVRFIFYASVPAAGYAVFDVRRNGIAVNTSLHAKGNTVEDERLRVTVNSNGDIASIYDKLNKREVLKAPARLDLQYENPKQFPAWNMDWEDQQKPPYGYVSGPAKITVIENGPVRATLRVERESHGSKFVQDIRLVGGSGQVDVLNHIDWQTKETALKASIPLANGSSKATYDLQVGAIERGNNNPRQYEVPQHQWFDVTRPDKTYGAAILNDSKFGSDKPDDNTVRLTLIYTPGVKGGFADQATQDFGRHDILYSIAPHSGDWAKGDVPWKAKRLNQPLRPFFVSEHSGSLGRTFSLFSTDSKQVEIQAIKKAEDSDNVIVRLRELTGKPAQFSLKAASPIQFAAVVDGQERRIDKVRVTNGALKTTMPAFSLKAFEIRLAPAGKERYSERSIPVKLPYDTDVASSFAKPGDGNFDGKGNALAADLLPPTLQVDGTTFTLGPTKDGAKNAVTASGQKLTLPSGYGRVYLLAASSGGDVDSTFILSGKPVKATVQDWGGYVGQWDNRLWAGDPGPNFTNYGEMVGLRPGYVRKGEVAWFANHSRSATGNAYYQYTYLFKIGLDVPRNGNTLVLPKDPRIKVLAVSVGDGGYTAAVPAAPLYDTLGDHRRDGAPTAEVSAPRPNDGLTVTLHPPLYWTKGSLWYKTGAQPSGDWFRYTGPMTFHDPLKLHFREGSGGAPSSIVTIDVPAMDTTPPQVASAVSPKALGLVRVRFSEAVDASAKDPRSYKFSSGASVASVRTNAEGDEVELTLDKPLPIGQTETLTVSGIKDRARKGNTLASTSVTVAERGAVFDAGTLEPKISKSFRNLTGLPTKAKDAWTVNLWCKIDEAPGDRVVIGGFGRSVDGRTGTGRYFTNFAQGINFWSANKDVMTREPLDIGKWQMLTATYDGEVLRVYKNGRKIAEKTVELSDDQSQAMAMPLDAWERERRFNGAVRDFTIWDIDLPDTAIQRLLASGAKE